ncbi:MAG: ATP-binding protein [Deltaproteobacteria bacterium]|jgi:hypothetical protein|nr:ATP-binding protein [Deltaproteobacteria bacterium]
MELPLQGFALSGESFRAIRKTNLLYVDKTKYIYDLIGPSRCIFLSRPLRFGKSLLLATMTELFKGNRELFEGLWINSSDYSFEKYPIVHLNLTGTLNNEEVITEKELDKSISIQLQIAAMNNGLPKMEGDNSSNILRYLINTLYLKTHKEIVFLIDEYDSPIREEFGNIDQARKNSKVLHAFYSTLKSLSDLGLLHFLFVTGIAKLDQASIFTVFNNLHDISLDSKYNGICGFTPDEFDTYFKNYLHDILAIYKEDNKFDPSYSIDVLKDVIFNYYDGYSWDGVNRVLNPYSLISFFAAKKFSKFWYYTATPIIIFQHIMLHPYEFINFNDYILNDDKLGAVDMHHMKLETLLFRTGYLTIDHKIKKEYLPTKDPTKLDLKIFDEEYRLKIPNFEVKDAFKVQFFEYLTLNMDKDDAPVLASNIRYALSNFDSTLLANSFSQILTAVTYQHQPDKESYHHAIIAVALITMDFNFTSEVSAPEGIYDFQIELPPNLVFIGEFKYAKLDKVPQFDLERHKQERLDAMAQLAQDQIIKKRYAKKYFKNGIIVKCLAVGIVGKTDVGVKFFDRPREWELIYANDAPLKG